MRSKGSHVGTGWLLVAPSTTHLQAPFMAEMVHTKAYLLRWRHIGSDLKGRQSLQMAVDQESACLGLTGRWIDLAIVCILRLRRQVVQKRERRGL